MSQSAEHNPVSPEALELGYQPEAINPRGLLIFFVCFVASAVVLHAVLSMLMKSFESRPLEADAPRSALASEQRPPAPNLQPSVHHDTLPYQDMEALRHREDVMFEKLGWDVNFATHEAQIPASIAARVAEEARTRAAAPSQPPSTTGKDFNSILPARTPSEAHDRPREGGQ